MGENPEYLSEGVYLVQKESLTVQTLEEVIELQRDWTSLQKKGNPLATCFDSKELDSLLERESHLYCLRDPNQILLGFILLQNMTGLYSQLLNTRDSLELDRERVSQATYLYQIVIRRGNESKGLGKVLLNTSCKGKHLVTDVLIKPRRNQRSLSFFESQHFNAIGRLRLEGYRNYGFLESIVYEKKNSYVSR